MFKSRSGQIAHFHGVKIRLSTLGTGDVPRGSDSTWNSRACLTKYDNTIERLGRMQSLLTILALGVSVVSGIRFGLQWTLGTLDKPFGFLVRMPHMVSSTDVSFMRLLRFIGLRFEFESDTGVVASDRNGCFSVEYSRSGFR